MSIITAQSLNAKIYKKWSKNNTYSSVFLRMRHILQCVNVIAARIVFVKRYLILMKSVWPI